MELSARRGSAIAVRSSGLIVVAILAAVVAGLTLTKRSRHHAPGSKPAPVYAAGNVADVMPTLAEATIAGQLVGRARVVDGDPLVMSGHHIRLFGIDAPETAQPCSTGARPIACGQAAKDALTRLIGSAPVLCERRNRDQYGRILAVCPVNGRDVGREMVASGWAVAVGRYSRSYAAAEAASRTARFGV